MPLPHDVRYPPDANPERFLTGTETGDLDDEEAAQLDDLFTLEMWDEIEAYEADLGWELSPQALRERVQADERRRGAL